MKSNYQYSLSQVLKSEGGYTNNPRDPGGPTNFGITIADYRMYVKRDATALDVRNMSLDDAKSIYKSKYWDKINGDILPSGVDYCVFDYAVNSGIGRAIRVYNRFKTLDPVHCINSICDERMSFLRSLRTFSTFGKGWTSRVSSVRTNSIKLSTKSDSVAASIPAAVVTSTGASVAAQHMNWFQLHPYLSVLGIVGVAIFIGAVVHIIHNRK